MATLMEDHESTSSVRPTSHASMMGHTTRKMLFTETSFTLKNCLRVTVIALLVSMTTACSKTTAERLVELLHSVNDYPLCDTGGCIRSIKAKGNTVIAEYFLPTNASEMPQDTFVNRADFADRIRPTVLRDICSAAQRDFPDPTMQWASHYYTKDGKFVASVIVSLGECSTLRVAAPRTQQT